MSMSAAGVQYAYDSRNKRIWRGILSNGNLAQQVYFYGVDGQKLGTYPLTLPTFGPGVVMVDGASTTLATACVPSPRESDILRAQTDRDLRPVGIIREILSLRRSARNRAAGRSRVCDVHAGFGDGVGLCGSALLCK